MNQVADGANVQFNVVLRSLDPVNIFNVHEDGPTRGAYSEPLEISR
jgi:hypothetical protein